MRSIVLQSGLTSRSSFLISFFAQTRYHIFWWVIIIWVGDKKSNGPCWHNFLRLAILNDTHTVWKLQNFTLTIFWRKFCETNLFTSNESYCTLISRNFFLEFFCTLCVQHASHFCDCAKRIKYLQNFHDMSICTFINIKYSWTRSVRTMMFLMTSLGLMIFLGFLNVFCYVFYSTFNRIFVSKLRWNANGHFIQNK